MLSSTATVPLSLSNTFAPRAHPQLNELLLYWARDEQETGFREGFQKKKKKLVEKK